MKKIFKTAEIICVGTELLLGDIVDTNSAFLSRELAKLGISVYHKCTVGDNPKRLRAVIDEAMERSDLIITSGGLGPTYDDLTKEVVAEAFGRELRENGEVLDRIRSYFAETGRKMTENNKKQAMIPSGAAVFTNNYGTAPAICIEGDECTAIMLPGPPRELEPLFSEEVVPYLEMHTDSVLVSKNILIVGMGESNVEAVLAPLMRGSENPTIAPYCKEGEVRLRVTSKAETREKASEMCDEMIEKVKNTEVGQFICGVDSEDIAAALVKLFSEKGITVSTAESCTGGLIAKMITDIAGSSAVLIGSAVTYAVSAKEKMIGVPAELIEKYGVVSAEVAEAMAVGVRNLLGTDLAVSTTGIAGPGGGTDDIPVGTVCIGIAGKNGVRSKRLSLPTKRDRGYVRTVAAKNALAELIAETKKI